MQNFVELQCLVDDLVDLLELPTFINASLPSNILLDDLDREFGWQKLLLLKDFYFYSGITVMKL